MRSSPDPRREGVLTEVLLVELDRFGSERFEPLGGQDQVRYPGVPRHDPFEAWRRIHVRVGRKVFGVLQHTLRLRRQEEVDEQHRGMRMLHSLEHLDAVAEAWNWIEQHRIRWGASAGTDDRMMRGDADADPVFAENDLVDNLAIADRKRHDVLFGERGKISFRLRLAPSREQRGDRDQRAA